MHRSGVIHWQWLFGLVTAVCAGLYGLWPAADRPAASASITSSRADVPGLRDTHAVAPGTEASIVGLPPDIARSPFGGNDWAPRRHEQGSAIETVADTAVAAQGIAAGPGQTAPDAPHGQARQLQAVPPAHVDGDNAPGIGHEPPPPPAPE